MDPGDVRRSDLLEEQLLRQAEEAARNGGVDLYLPVEDWHGFLVSASLVVSEVVPDATSGLEEVGPVMADLLRDADARPETIDGTVFVQQCGDKVSNTLETFRASDAELAKSFDVKR